MSLARIDRVAPDTVRLYTGDMKLLGLVLGLFLATPAEAQLAAAVLPLARSVQLGQPATAFATIINASTATAHSCTIAPMTSVPGSFLYQTTDPKTNQLTGTPNTPVNIAPGGAQTFLISFMVTAEFSSTVFLNFDCADTAPAPNIVAVNTLALTVVNRPVDDVIPIASTQTKDGIVNIPGLNGTGAFAMAAVNIGNGGICCMLHTDTAAPNVTLSICQTDPTSGMWLQPPVQGLLRWNSAPGVPATFSVFAKGSGNVPFNPATNRIYVTFKDFALFFPDLGLTGVAVRTQP